ncbi:MAG: protein kinase [Marinilabiliaceae bacterium]|nr:protein kinase [Marinilabiliaceae bacterium]
MFSIKSEKNSYCATDLLSSGKFGAVWVGKCAQTKEQVIIKEYSAAQIEVAKKLSKIEHPALQTCEIAYSDDKLFVVRKYIPGINLKMLLSQKQKFSTDFWVKGFIHLLEGLQVLHENGIIHRDIKPSNIIIADGNSPNSEWQHENFKLIDFEQALSMTHSNKQKRTPFAFVYAPPEQLLNRNTLTCPQSDLFALGLTLFEAINKRKAFEFYDPEMLLHIQLNIPLKNRGIIDKKLFEIILKSTEKTPFRLPPSRLTMNEIDSIIKSGIDKRYTSAKEMANDLKEWLKNY